MSSKTKEKHKDKAAGTPLDSLQRALQDPAAEDVDGDGLDNGLDQVSDAGLGDSPSSAQSDFISVPCDGLLGRRNKANCTGARSVVALPPASPNPFAPSLAFPEPLAASLAGAGSDCAVLTYDLPVHVLLIIAPL